MRAKNLQRNLFPSLARLTRFVFISILLVGLLVGAPGAASAYTVVFRDGQRIEVAPVFGLTSTTLTCEVVSSQSLVVSRSTKLSLQLTTNN